jgi:hypothetical protein
MDLFETKYWIGPKGRGSLASHPLEATMRSKPMAALGVALFTAAIIALPLTLSAQNANPKSKTPAKTVTPKSIKGTPIEQFNINAYNDGPRGNSGTGTHKPNVSSIKVNHNNLGAINQNYNGKVIVPPTGQPSDSANHAPPH